MSKQLAITGDYWGLTGQFLLWGAFSFSDNKNEKFQYASTAFLANGMITYGIKYIVGRERPDRSNKRSFPSGHTSNSFLTASVAQEIYGSKVGIPAYLMATLSGLSRIQDNKHYLSDVIFGATLGIAVGKGFGHVYRQNRKLVQIRVIPFQQTLCISMALGKKSIIQ
jgi:membrane-associated phospholipid phosphatase